MSGKNKGHRSVLSKAAGAKSGDLAKLALNHGLSRQTGGSSKGGAARLGVLLGLGLLLVGGILFWVLGDGGRKNTQKLGPSSSGSITRIGQPKLGDELRQPKSSDGSRHDELLQGPPGDLSLNGSGIRKQPKLDRFQGRGSIRGQVFMSDRSPITTPWTLVARPSKMLRGGEFAELRQMEFKADVTEFQLEDLPLGSYDLLASSSTSNARLTQVILERDNRHPFINIQMDPAGQLDGRVLDFEGLPATGVVINLTREKGRERQRTVTDELGRYRFARVLDDAYRLTIGEFENPIMPRTGVLRLTAPGMTMPNIKLPQLATLNLHLMDQERRNLSEVLVRGVGDHGGSVETKTDIFGILQVKHLPAGRYRLSFICEGYKVKRSPIDIKLGQDNGYAVELLLE